MSKSDDNDISFAFERLSLCTDANENASHTNALTENIFQAIDIIRNKKRKRPDTKSLFEFIKKNDNSNITESQLNDSIDKLIELKLIYNKKTDQGLDSFYKTTEKDNETPLDLSYLAESTHSDTPEEETFCNLSKISSHPSIPNIKNVNTPVEKTVNTNEDKTSHEKHMLKTEAKISALRSFIDCEISEIDKKVNSFSETLNQILKDLEKMQKDHTLLLRENTEFLKNELKSKDEIIKCLIDTQTLSLDSLKTTRINQDLVQEKVPDKAHEKVQEKVEKNQVNHNTYNRESDKKKTLILGNLSSFVTYNDIMGFFGLNATKYLRENCKLDFPMNPQTGKNKGCAYLTIPAHVADEIIKLNNIELKGQQIVMEDAQIKPQRPHSNQNNFLSPNRFGSFLNEDFSYDDNQQTRNSLVISFANK